MIRLRRFVAIWVGLVLTAGLMVAVQPGSAGAAEQWPPRQPARPYLVQTSAVPVKPSPPDMVMTAVAGGGSPAVSWPAGGAAEVQVGSAKAAGLPVWIGPSSAAAPAGHAAAGAPPSPAAVRAEVLDHAAAAKQGVDGLVLRLRRSDGQTGAGKVSLRVEYSGFRGAHGGDWAARLRLLELPTTGPATSVASRNDLKAGQVTADVTVTGADTTFALSAAPNGETGDYKATSLSPSGTWSVSTQSGDFDYSYPLRVPKVPGDLVPKLALGYSSGSVDGHTASTNNQPSWIGEGWSLWPGSIERNYKSCFDDNTEQAKKTGDECWGGDNATMSLGGHAQRMVFAGNNTWHPKQDDGSRLQHLTGAANGDQGDVEGAGEYWKLTTTDGTQYFFGRTTSSTWTVPVFGNNGGEPCIKSTFAASWCQQAYRWNLDQVIDPHGNTISYFYTPETNNYSLDIDTAKPTRYVRGGVLEHVEYGARAGQHPAAQVLFAADERGGPDVPTDQACADGQNCGAKYAPTFWSTKRLASVTTQVWDGAWHDVDRWTLEHAYPPNQDGTTASLWLHGITHTGLAAGPNVTGSNVSLPKVVFDGTQLPNRLNSDTDGLMPLDKWRIHQISNETGGWIWINYLTTDCPPDAHPAPESNTKRCFPVTWTPDGDQLRHDWMVKYVVESVVSEDRVGGQPSEMTSYDYGTGGTAWHYDDNPLVPDQFRSWSQFRGYGDVVVKHGDPTVVTPSATRYTYFRGMNGDHLPNNGTRSAKVKDSQDVELDDSDQFAGFVREEQTYNGAGGPVLSSEINDPWQHGPTATQGSLQSWVVQTRKTVTRTALQAADGSLRGWRTTQVDTDYTDEGLPKQVNDLGDVATGADDRCSTTTYARNLSSWVLDRPSEVKVDGVACTVTPSYPRDAVSDTRTYYDDGGLGAPPSAGSVTRTEQAKGYSGGQPVWVTISHGTFDAYGRPQDAYDALDRKTITRYAPDSGLPTTQSVTDPMGNTTATSLDVVLGQPVTVTDPNSRRTDLTYDSLGRLLGVWRPGRSKQNGDGPNQRYAYGVRPDGASWVSAQTLKANNNYLTSYKLYDGFLRERQTQSLGEGPADTGPLRVLADKLYDARGLVFQRNGPYSDTGTPGTTLAGIADAKVPSMTRASFDAAERPTTIALLSRGTELARTTTKYFGDHTEATPPAGGTPTATFTDARGQTRQLWQYKAATPSGAHTTTSYDYTNAGQLATVTDTALNTWRYTYDLLGHQTATNDPDKGNSTSIYDDAGQVTSTTDARGITLAYKYDGLGRKLEEHQDSLAGPLLASWTYDTILKGQLTSSTGKNGTETFTRTITGYDAAYRPTGTTISVPDAPWPLNSDWSTTMTYKADGSPDKVTLPSLPGVGGETLTYSYDSLGMAYELKNAAGKYVHDAAYTEFGELSQLQLGASPQQALQTFYFDMGTRRLTRSVVDLEHDQLSGQPPRSVQDLNYSYDPAGNLTQLADTPTIGATDKQCFTYDPLRRLREAWATTTTCGAPGSNPGGAAPYWISYTFDDIGNRLSDTTHAVGGSGVTADASRTFAYPAGGQPRPHAVTSVSAPGASQAASAFSYDPAGNTTSRPGPGGTQTLTWTPEGKLSTVTSTAGVTTDRYDADTDLLLTKDPSGTTLYLDDAEVRVTSTGQTTAARYYSFAGTTVGVRTSTSGLSWLAHDSHGTDNLDVNAADSKVTLRRSDPFGNPRGTQPAWPGSHGFVGGVAQPTGMTHLGAREYDPLLGKFLSVDPILDPRDPRQFNAYAYATNNPTTMSDPSGLKIFEGDSGGWTDSHGSTTINNSSGGGSGGGGGGGSKPTSTKTLPHGTRVTTVYDPYGDIVYINGLYINPNMVPDIEKFALLFDQYFADDFHSAIKDRGVRTAAAMSDACQTTTGVCTNWFASELTAIIARYVNKVTGCDDRCQKFGDFLVGIGIQGGMMAASRLSSTAGRNGLKGTASDISLFEQLICMHSFRADTLVLMADGSTKPISKVRLGDKVKTTDPRTGRTITRRVTALHHNRDTDRVDLTVKDARGRSFVLHTTQHHAFWDDTRGGWVEAGSLRSGDRLHSQPGAAATVLAVVPLGGQAGMYDLTVGQVHTYYVEVGDTPVLVHNAPPAGCALTSAATAPRIYSKTIYQAKNGSFRIDIENPLPGQPGANIHLQPMGRGASGKYYYHPESGTWLSEDGAPLGSRMANQVPQNAIDKAFQYLGIPTP